MKKSRLLGAVCACVIASISSQVMASLIDFETVPGGTPSDELAITNQYLADFGVTFSLSTGGDPHLEQVGSNSTDDLSTESAFFLTSGGWDDERAGSGFEGELGNYFLRIGTGGLQSAPAPILIIDYSSPVSAASAQIWDIDGTNNNNTEQWTITAHDNIGNIIDTIVSPTGTRDNAASLDGLPWTWSFSHATNDIYSIQVEFTGGKTNNIGLAFDNFSPSSAVVPLPASIWLFGTGLLGLFGIARKKIT